jgi:response regulator RpfG family c-di-GMP phosphodiesterase
MSERQASILFVDDEANILAALRRLFRSRGYVIFTAGSGQEGLEVLEKTPIDLVVSDMRMPAMSGAEFLERVRQRWPATMRILLTGYADIASTIDAINRGEIYRYIAKPWEDNDILLVVKEALERKFLEEEKHRLEELTRRQNEELKNLNASLEEKVKARTAELAQTLSFLEQAHEQLKHVFLTSLQVFANLMELRGGRMAGHAKRVAETCRLLTRKMNLSAAESQDVLVAALLHDIGMMGLPESLLDKPDSSLTAEERAELRKHPVRGAAALMALEQLRGAAKLIRAHHERFDGQGYPDGLTGLAIPLGARILAVANDYDGLCDGRLTAHPMNPREALDYIRESRGKRYDPRVVDAFCTVMERRAEVIHAVNEQSLTPLQLRPGMVTTRDVVTRDGLLLLAREFVLDESIIEQLRLYEKTDGHPLPVHVHAHQTP